MQVHIFHKLKAVNLAQSNVDVRADWSGSFSIVTVRRRNYIYLRLLHGFHWFSIPKVFDAVSTSSFAKMKGPRSSSDKYNYRIFTNFRGLTVLGIGIWDIFISRFPRVALGTITSEGGLTPPV